MRLTPRLHRSASPPVRRIPVRRITIAMSAIGRTLRARLPNGVVVAVRADTRSEFATGAEEAARLAWLLDKTDTREVDLLDFLVTVAPMLFPEADPAKRPKLSHGAVERGVDLAFHLREHPGIGIVEIKTHRTAVRSGRQISRSLEMALKQIDHYLQRQPTEVPIKVAYVIAGRRSTMTDVGRDDVRRTAASVPVQVWTWDDVAELLQGTGDGDPEPDYEIVLVEVVELSRRLLRALLRQPALLAGIDDRKLEELVATLLFDLGLQDIELTPARKDGGRDIIARYDDPATDRRYTYLVECKHWICGNKVTLRWALSLLDVAERESASGAVLLSSSGFGPRLLEQEASLEAKGLMLRDSRDLRSWIDLWERQYGSVLVQPVDPMTVFASAGD